MTKLVNAKIRVHASIASSVDGYIDDASNQRLILSSAEDLADVHRRRSECDAIFVGAETVRVDNPSLVLRDAHLIAARIAKGLPAQLVKVTATLSGDLESESKFFRVGECPKWVICPTEVAPQLRQKLGNFADEVIAIPRSELNAARMVGELEKRGIKSVFLEGGTSLLTLFLKEERVDTLRLAIAPFFVGQPEAPRLAGSGIFPFNRNHRMKLRQVSQLGDTAVLDYSLK